MNITVDVFAQLKDFFDQQFEIELPEKSKISDLLSYLANQRPAAQLLLKSTLVAINEEIVDLQSAITDDDHLYLLPPVSGG